jgi:hypothetical protein
MEETKEEIKQEGDFKIKKKPGRPRKLTSQKEPVKLDLNKTKEEDAVQAQETSDSDVAVEEKKDETGSAEVVEEIRDAEEVKSTEEEQSVVISEVPAEEIKTEEPIVEETKRQLPEGIDKLVSFMEETGGTMSDYIRLNADYSNVDEDTLLKEYYKNTKPHLDAEEINFIMEEQFKVDEDYDEEREVRRKKLAKKEEVAKAKNFLEDLKVKYYEEIKSRPTVNNEMTKANEFFNKFKQQQEIAKQQHEQFKTKTNKFFSEEFKGFEFNLGDKRFRYSVNNASSVGESQSDISNVVKKFLNEKGEVVDVEGYHKAMYAANNADTIAQHFYEQGKADATKNIVANSKNINKEVRTKAPEDLYLNGFKLKAVSGMNSSKLKINKK